MLLDTWAWIEYFKGSEKGRTVRQIIEKTAPRTSVLSIAEIANWCARNDLDPSPYISAIKASSGVIGVKEEVAKNAGTYLCQMRKQAPGMGMVDSLIYTEAISSGTKLLTGDPHFKNLEGVEFIG